MSGIVDIVLRKCKPDISSSQSIFFYFKTFFQSVDIIQLLYFSYKLVFFNNRKSEKFLFSWKCVYYKFMLSPIRYRCRHQEDQQFPIFKKMSLTTFLSLFFLFLKLFEVEISAENQVKILIILGKVLSVLLQTCEYHASKRRSPLWILQNRGLNFITPSMQM